MSEQLLEEEAKAVPPTRTNEGRKLWIFFRLPFGKKYKVKKFYRQQSDLLEKYEEDKCQVREEINRRSLRISNGEDDSQNDLLASNSNYPTPLDLSNSESPNSPSKVHPKTAVIFSNDEVDSPIPKCVTDTPADREKRLSRASLLAKITLLINISLTIAKFVASYLSGSLSIISSLVDSIVDITSGIVIWTTSRAINKTDPYTYPVGRSRLEPIALVIVSVIMGVASVQMIVQSLESIVMFRINPHVDIPTLVIMLSTIFIKFALFLVCKKFKDDPSIQILGQDHRNDCLSNSCALLFAFCAQKFWIYLDPIGAIIVALYIAVTWYFTGKEQLVRLSGKSAKPEFINRIIKICIDHDSRIDYIDTVYVYHFGTRFLVEVHIVMDQEMKLRETHDIAELLQNKIESLQDVERAFVHVDFDFDHKPTDEHFRK